MNSMPGSFDGAEGEAFDEAGRKVARVVLADQRVPLTQPSGKPGRIQGAVLGSFEDADPLFASALPRLVGGDSRKAVSVTIVLGSEDRFENVRVLPPFEDAPGPIDALLFPLSHPEF